MTLRRGLDRRERDGELPGATSTDLRVIVVCNEGYASSLAAESLRRLGLHRATDLAGGYQAWLQDR